MDSYRSLEAWKRAHELVIATLKAVDRSYHPRSGALFEQLRRATISVEANLVEGYALRTVPLFRRHLRIALGSAAEAECLVRTAAELKYLSEATFRELQALLDRTMPVLVGLFQMANTRC